MLMTSEREAKSVFLFYFLLSCISHIVCLFSEKWMLRFEKHGLSFSRTSVSASEFEHVMYLTDTNLSEGCALSFSNPIVCSNVVAFCSCPTCFVPSPCEHERMSVHVRLTADLIRVCVACSY
jgi:hypothetical protein